jgi:hypothetical protein
LEPEAAAREVAGFGTVNAILSIIAEAMVASPNALAPRLKARLLIRTREALS